MEGRATLTMVASRMTMNWASATRTRTSQGLELRPATGPERSRSTSGAIVAMQGLLGPAAGPGGTERLSDPIVDSMKYRAAYAEMLECVNYPQTHVYCRGMKRHARKGESGGQARDPRAEELIDALGLLFMTVRDHFERNVARFDLPGPCAKALRVIDGAVSMKELGSRIH